MHKALFGALLLGSTAVPPSPRGRLISNKISIYLWLKLFQFSTFLYLKLS